MSEKFKIGDSVVWTSQAQGTSKEKRGVVVGIIPEGFRPSREDFAYLYKGYGCGHSRKHESYVVRIKNRFYWPIVNKLQRVAK